MSGYETEELGRIEDALDGLDSPTSEDVFQATRPYDERAIASVAAARAGSGGSSSLVSCYIVGPLIDISAEGTYGFKPTGVYDNAYDFNALPGLPDGLGWSMALDGSSDTITVDEDGIWAYTWTVEFDDGNDATFTGEFGDSFFLAKRQLSPIVGCQVLDANSTYESISATGVFSAGSSFRFFLKTSTAFTTSPYHSRSFLSLVRLS